MRHHSFLPIIPTYPVQTERRRGLLPFVNGSRTHVVPALNITDDEARYGLALLDDAIGEIEASLR